MKHFIVFILLSLLQSFHAQDSTFIFKPSNFSDSTVGVVYFEDPRTDVLLKELKTYDIQGDVVIIDGYRIQIFFTNDRKLAEEQRLKFIRLYPEHETTVEYDAPNYILRAGAFKTRDEAEEFRGLITKEFPMSIIQRQKIKVPIEKNLKSNNDSSEE